MGWSLWLNEWLLLNANSAIVQLYNGKNKLIFIEMMIDDVRFVIDVHAEVEFL